MKKHYKADAALLLVTIFWGLSYILSKSSLDSLSTFNFLSIRFLIATVVSIPLCYKRLQKLDKTTLKYGILIGIIMFLGYSIQTIGLNYTTASKSAFIIGFAVILVPILSALLLKKIPKTASILGVVLAIIGLALLTLDGNLRLNIGDILTFIAAICFSFHILAISKYAPCFDTVNLAVIQIAVVGILSTLISFMIEQPIIPSSMDVWKSILFLSLLCTAAAFIVQNTAQKYTSATHTALIFSGEPVFAAICAFFLLGEILSLRGIFGSFLIILGMLTSEFEINLPFKQKKVGANPTSLDI